MLNKVLEDIKNYAVQRLKNEYGYCGVLDGETMAMLNSSDESFDFIVNIKVERSDT